MLRKKQPNLKCKRVQRDKTISAPPIGVPSWCLNREALEKFNRIADDIPVYDYNDTDEDIQDDDNNSNKDTDNDDDNNNDLNNENRGKRKKSKKSLKRKLKQKKDKKHKSGKKRK